MALGGRSKRLDGVRERLIEVGARLVRDVGPELSVDRICEEAACSKGAFYHHFRNKRDFLRSCLAGLGTAALAPEVLLRILPYLRQDAGARRGMPPDQARPTPEEAVLDAVLLGEGLRRAWSRGAAAGE
jgi:AcrR family transcriptional regulator